MIWLEFMEFNLSTFKFGRLIDHAIVQLEFIDFNLSKETNKKAFCKIVIIISCFKLKNKAFGVVRKKCDVILLKSYQRGESINTCF